MVKLPPQNVLMPGRGVSLKGVGYSRWINGRLYWSKWPRRQPTARTPKEADNRRLFAAAAEATLYMSANEVAFARSLAKDTKLLPRDFLMIALFGRIGTFIRTDGSKIYSMAAIRDVSMLIDALEQRPGSLLLRGAELWEGIPVGLIGDALVVLPDGSVGWAAGGGGGGGGWTDLVISPTSLGAAWSQPVNYPAGAPIVVQGGDLLEVRMAFNRPPIQAASLNLSPDLAFNYQVSEQSDNNCVTYRYVAFNNTQTLLGGSSVQNFEGTFYLQSNLQIGYAGRPTLCSTMINQVVPRGVFSLSQAQFPVGASGVINVVVGYSATVNEVRVQYRRSRPL